ncbi:MAG TPA: hypothetical protein VGU25_08280 [Acidobacteriaceae bacterium]|nr:hypothetical protein [Acidobacteriaceae bacterium]
MHESNDQNETKSILDRFGEWYEACVPIRVGAVALAVPTHGITALADAGIISALAFLKRERLQCLTTGLTQLNLHPSPEEIRTQRFLEAFAAAAAKAMETRRQEKIELLARVFAAHWRENRFSTVEAQDLYEEDLEIIDELGYREFVILSLLYKHECETQRDPRDNDLIFARKFWDQFEDDVEVQTGISRKELQGHLQRLARTGLYQPIVGAYLGYTGGLGSLTERFRQLKELLSKHQAGTEQVA